MQTKIEAVVCCIQGLVRRAATAYTALRPGNGEFIVRNIFTAHLHLHNMQIPADTDEALNRPRTEHTDIDFTGVHRMVGSTATPVLRYSFHL